MKNTLFSSLLFLGALAINAQDLQMLLDSSNYYWETEEYTKAFETINRAKLEAERALEAEEEFAKYNYALVLNKAGIMLLEAEDYDRSIEFIASAADLYEEVEGENSPDRLITLENLAVAYSRKGSYFMSAFWYDLLLQNEAYLESQADDLFLTYNNAAIASQLGGMRDDAYVLFEKSLGLLDPEDPNYWAVMENILAMDRDMGYGLESEKYQKMFFQKFPDRKAEFTNLVAYRHREQALAAFGENDYRAAIPFLEKTLESLSPNDSLSYKVKLNTVEELALSYVNTSQYLQARKYAIENEELNKEFYGEESDNYLYALNYLTLVNSELADYRAAEKVYSKAYRILKNYDSETKGELTALFDTNYAELLTKQGKYEEAQEFVKRAISFYATDEIYFDDLVFSMNQTAVILISLGQYDKAEGLLQQTLNMQNQKHGLENEMATKIASNLTTLYMETGRNSRALQYVQFILANDRANHGENSFEYSFSQQVAGTLFLSMGAHEEAIDMLNKAYELRKTMVNESNRELLRLKQTLGSAYRKGGKFGQAQKLLEETLDVQQRTIGNQNFDVALTMNDLGMVHISQKEYDQAKSRFQEALKIQDKVLGPYNQFTCTSLYNLACANYLTGNPKKSLEYFKQAIGNYLHILDEFFPHLSEKERLEYYHTIKGQLGAYFSLINDMLDENPELAAELYDVQIRTKAMLLNESMELRNYLDKQSDPKIKATYLRWVEINKEVAKLEQFSNEGDQKIYLDSLKIVGEEYERVLNSLPKKASNKVTKWRDVAGSLADGEVAIEIIGITPFVFEEIEWNKEGRQYLALIIDNKTTDYPKYVRLENGAEMDAKSFSLYKNKIKFKLKDTDSHGNFWQPIANQLKGYDKVYFSSDGIYHLLNLNTLYNPETDKYVIEDWNIEIVGNTKELVGRESSEKKASEAILFGFPDFNAQAHPETKNTDRTSVFREIFTEGVSDLPGTKVEVENIHSLMTDQGIDSKSFLAKDAHESQLKSIESVDILHIATHGFFEESSEDVVNDDPLLHSGLLLANLKESIMPAEENGIITAKEIAQLDLHGNQLVVLSACETGKGKIVDGQGVYGLQRAFQVAGAQNVVISLWKVDDEATKELMILFYKDYLENGNARQSLKSAQLKLKEQFPEPIYWGAFYVVGG